jgi:hypothetical protein
MLDVGVLRKVQLGLRLGTIQRGTQGIDHPVGTRPFTLVALRFRLEGGGGLEGPDRGVVQLEHAGAKVLAQSGTLRGLRAELADLLEIESLLRGIAGLREGRRRQHRRQQGECESTCRPDHGGLPSSCAGYRK